MISITVPRSGRGKDVLFPLEVAGAPLRNPQASRVIKAETPRETHGDQRGGGHGGGPGGVMALSPLYDIAEAPLQVRRSLRGSLAAVSSAQLERAPRGLPPPPPHAVN